MQYRSLGSSGLKVSAVGLGNQFGGKADLDTTKDIISAALEDNGVPAVVFRNCPPWEGHDNLYFSPDEDIMRKLLKP